MIVVGGEKQGNERVRFLDVCPGVCNHIILAYLYVVYCSSVWSFGSPFNYWRYVIARVSEMHVAHIK